MSLEDTTDNGDIYDSIRDGRHPTGITVLDEEELRGIPEGTTVAILGDPDSASELILHSLAATGRETQYITTNRGEQSIKTDIKRIAGVHGREDDVEENLTIRDTYGSGGSSYDDIIRRGLGTIGNGNLIVDTFSKKHDKDNLADVARRIHTKTKKNNGLTYLYFVAEDVGQLTRQEQEILQLVDGVFNVKTQVRGGDNIENQMFINKLRGMDFPERAQTLNFGRELNIDTTGGIG